MKKSKREILLEKRVAELEAIVRKKKKPKPLQLETQKHIRKIDLKNPSYDKITEAYTKRQKEFARLYRRKLRPTIGAETVVQVKVGKRTKTFRRKVILAQSQVTVLNKTGDTDLLKDLVWASIADDLSHENYVTEGSKKYIAQLRQNKGKKPSQWKRGRKHWGKDKYKTVKITSFKVRWVKKKSVIRGKPEKPLPPEIVRKKLKGQKLHRIRYGR